MYEILCPRNTYIEHLPISHHEYMSLHLCGSPLLEPGHRDSGYAHARSEYESPRVEARMQEPLQLHGSIGMYFEGTTLRCINVCED